MFDSCYALTSINLNNFIPKKVKDMSYVFNNCHSLKIINLEKFDTSEVTKMQNMFYNNTSLKELDLSSFKTEKCSDFHGMFEKIENLTIKVDPRYTTNLIQIFQNSIHIINVTSY